MEVWLFIYLFLFILVVRLVFNFFFAAALKILDLTYFIMHVLCVILYACVFETPFPLIINL